MKIIILGAGQVGTALAERLAQEHNDITIIDTNETRLKNLQERIDVMTIAGNGSSPNSLKRARAEDTDLLICVTNNDEVNLVACQVADTLFQIPTKIARIRNLDYLAREELFGSPAFPIDVLISPEQVVSDYIKRLIEHPDAEQVFAFNDEKLFLVKATASKEACPMIGQPIKNLPLYLGKTQTEIVLMIRDGKQVPISSTTVIEPFDEIFFLCTKHHIQQVISTVKPLDLEHQRIILAGGGNIGTRLAAALEDQFEVKIIDNHPARIEFLATHLNQTVVLNGDAADKELLLSEGIVNTDMFCAITNHDETNIMAALLAKKLGVRRVLALVSRPSYLDLLEEQQIDIVVSPQEVTIGSLLTHIRRGSVVNVHSLHRGQIEAIEILVSTKDTPNIVAKNIQNLNLPQGVYAGAVVRENEVIMGYTNPVLQEGDHVIILVVDKKKIRHIERLFQNEHEFNT